MLTIAFAASGTCHHCGRPDSHGLRVGTRAHTPTLICDRCVDALRWSLDLTSGLCWCCGEIGAGRVLHGHCVCVECRDALLGRVGVGAG